MKVLSFIVLIYATLISLVVFVSSTFPFKLVFLPITLFLCYSLFIRLTKTPREVPLKKLFIYYGFVLTTVMAIMGALGARSVPEVIASGLFLPLWFYFAAQVLPRNSRALVVPALVVPDIITLTPTKPVLKRLATTPGFDLQRRTFLKLIGSAGLAVLFFSLFTRKAHGAFFGSVPGPGTVALKDISGAVVDPAISTPTDGYKISDIDSSSPAYYGFIDKTGRWFIMKEGTSGDYRYIKGASSYSTNWTGRAALSYDTFDSIF